MSQNNIEIKFIEDSKALDTLNKKIQRTTQKIQQLSKAGTGAKVEQANLNALSSQVAKDKLLIISKKTKLAISKKDYQIQKIKQKQLEMEAATRKAINMQQNKMVGFLKKGQDAQIGFNGAALSGLFFGMALQKAFGGALKSIFEGYKKIIPESHKFNQMTTQLSANWEFFKFQMADALANSPLFQTFIGFLIRVIQAFQKLNPETKVFLGTVLAIGAALGALLVIQGTLTLGLGGLVDSMQLLSAETGKFQWGKLKTFGFIALAAAALWGLNEAMNSFQEHSEVGKKKWSLFKDAMTGVATSVINPILEGFTNMGLSVKNMGEVFIVTGAIWQNVLVGLGMMVNALIPILRTLFNAFQLLMNTAIALTRILHNLFTLDFKEAKSVWNDYKKSVLRDLNDIGDAWSSSQENFNKLQSSIVTGQDIQASIADLRQGAQEKSITENNTYIVTLDEAVAIGKITQEGKDALSNLGVVAI